MKKSNILHSVILPLFVMMLWGTLYPIVKISYDVFGINTNSVADILMFASVRFVFCGILLCIIAHIKKESLEKPEKKSIGLIVLAGFFSIFLHYALTYVGLSVTDSSKSALIKQLGTLLYVCFAFLFVKDEKFNKFKIIGALVGFAGIIAINRTGKSFIFEVGDILLILSSFCTVISSIISKITVQKSSPLWVAGISQLSGGLFLLAVAIIMGGAFPVFTLKSVPVFAYICISSIIGYTVWYYVMKTISVSRLFIIRFAEPLFACIFSALWLGEDIFKIQYLLAFILISTGITLGNRN